MKRQRLKETSFLGAALAMSMTGIEMPAHAAELPKAGTSITMSDFGATEGFATLSVLDEVAETTGSKKGSSKKGSTSSSSSGGSYGGDDSSGSKKGSSKKGSSSSSSSSGGYYGGDDSSGSKKGSSK